MTLNETILEDKNVIQFPIAGASLIFIYNLPEEVIGTNRLNLTLDSLFQIYNGSIVSWDDERILSANPGFLQTPNSTIAPLHFDRESGCTLILTTVFSMYSSSWDQVGENITWPVIEVCFNSLYVFPFFLLSYLTSPECIPKRTLF